MIRVPMRSIPCRLSDKIGKCTLVHPKQTMVKSVGIYKPGSPLTFLHGVAAISWMPGMNSMLSRTYPTIEVNQQICYYIKTMGLDYSFRLYFKRENLWEVLQGIAAISTRSELPTLIVYPDHIRPLALEAWGKNERIVNYNDAQFGFVTSIYFPIDNAITEYINRVFPKKAEGMFRQNPLGVPVGYIYITVYNDLTTFEEKDWDPKLFMIDFGTPGTTMSILFFESGSIRRQFIRLLAQYQGVCGVFNMENSGRVIWLNGQSLDIEIPDPFMSPQEIEEYIKSK